MSHNPNWRAICYHEGMYNTTAHLWTIVPRWSVFQFIESTLGQTMNASLPRKLAWQISKNERNKPMNLRERRVFIEWVRRRKGKGKCVVIIF